MLVGGDRNIITHLVIASPKTKSETGNHCHIPKRYTSVQYNNRQPPKCFRIAVSFLVGFNPPPVVMGR